MTGDAWVYTSPCRAEATTLLGDWAAQRAIAALNALRRNNDPEEAHTLRDDILHDYLRATGALAVADASKAAEERNEFWYA